MSTNNLENFLTWMKFFQIFSYRMCADFHFFTNFAVAKPLGLQLCGFSRQEMSSVPFVQAFHKFQIVLWQYFWRRFLFHFKSIGITLKVTKNPPDFQIYLTDIQYIKQYFCNFLLSFIIILKYVKWLKKWVKTLVNDTKKWGNLFFYSY